MRSLGFTLIELLIVVAILGILAAVGVPMYSDYISDVKETAAKNGLHSIYLMQQDWFSENGSYCISQCNNTTNIQTNLFNSDFILDSSDYNYYVRSFGTGYRAHANPHSSSSNLKNYRIDHKNTLEQYN